MFQQLFESGVTNMIVDWYAWVCFGYGGSRCLIAMGTFWRMLLYSITTAGNFKVVSGTIADFGVPRMSGMAAMWVFTVFRNCQ